MVADHHVAELPHWVIEDGLAVTDQQRGDRSGR